MTKSCENLFQTNEEIEDLTEDSEYYCNRKDIFCKDGPGCTDKTKSD